MTDSIIMTKSYSFALRIVNAYKYLIEEKREFVLSKQMLRSGTSIGAMVRESKFAQSKLDFINKLSIGLKEANETMYWMDLLHDSGYIEEGVYLSIRNDCDEIVSILAAIVKTSKETLNS